MTDLECDCGYPARLEQNRKDWDATPRGNSIWTGSTGKSWPPFPVWHFQGCASLEPYPLAPWADARSCAKCGSSDIRSKFHTASWHYKPHHHDYWRMDLYAYECALTIRYRPVEHIDRACRNCDYRWLETTASETLAVVA